MAVYEREREEMVDRLVASGYLKSPRVVEAMKKVPRHLFVPEDVAASAYYDYPLPIGEGQTISAPHMVAMMCDALGLEEGQKVLEVGAGSGYHACVVAEVVKREVVAMERIERLAVRAGENIARAGYRNIRVVVGDGTRGYAEGAPYDRILVTAGAPDVPEPLIEQLVVGGRLLIPVGETYVQHLLLVTKGERGVEKTALGGCMFVPLIGEHGW